MNPADYQKQPLEVFEDELEVELGLGEAVEVLGGSNTSRNGIIRDVVWHTKLGEWHYYIESNGKKVSTRYSASDLKRISEQDAAGNPLPAE